MVGRSFFAVDLREKIKEKIAEKVRGLKRVNADLKIVKRENWHITLKFLGDIDQSQVRRIKKKLKRVVNQLKPFKISLKGGGVFPDLDYIKVIWVGLNKGSDKVKELNREINRVLEGMDVAESHHEYTPHITIARAKSGRGKREIQGFVESLKDEKFGEQVIKKIKLKESILKGEGPKYSDLSIFDL